MKNTEYKKSNPPVPPQTLIPWLLEAIPESTFDKVRLVLGLMKNNSWEPPPREAHCLRYQEDSIKAAHEQCETSREIARYGSAVGRAS